MGLVSLYEEEERPELSLSLSLPCEDTEKAAVCKPEEGPHEGNESTSTLELSRL